MPHRCRITFQRSQLFMDRLRHGNQPRVPQYITKTNFIALHLPQSAVSDNSTNIQTYNRHWQSSVYHEITSFHMKIYESISFLFLSFINIITGYKLLAFNCILFCNTYNLIRKVINNAWVLYLISLRPLVIITVITFELIIVR